MQVPKLKQHAATTDRMQNKQFLSQQSKQKRYKIKIGIFAIMFRFPNDNLKLKAPDQPQSVGEESHLTGDTTQFLCNALCKF